MVGIYKITNKINNKVYIGQSKDIESRWESHKYYTYSTKTKLQYAFAKYGIFNFLFQVIEECDISNLDEREKFWISYYNSYEDGYNMTMGGQEGRTLDYDTIIADFDNTHSIHKTAENLHLARGTIRNVLDIYKIPYDKGKSQPQSVIMIDPYTLEEKKTFPSIKDAAEYLHLSEAALRKYFSGDTKTCGGYYWKKSNENKNFIKLKENEKINQKKTIKSVLQYTLAKELVAEYPSLSAANRAIGKSRSNQQIPNACKNHTEAFGFLWEFK